MGATEKSQRGWRRRRFLRMGVHAGLVIVLGALLVSLVDGPSPRYSIVEIEPFPGGGRVVPSDINNLGQVVGMAEINQPNLAHAFIWSESRGMEDLGIEMERGESGRCHINDLGQVTVPAFIKNATYEGWGSRLNILRSATGEMITLGGRGPETEPVINNRGQMVFVRDQDYWAQLILREADGRETILEEGPSTLNAKPVSLTDTGSTLLRRSTGKPVEGSFVRSSSGEIEIRTVSEANFAAYWAIGLNERGQVAGTQVFDTGKTQIEWVSIHQLTVPILVKKACVFEDGNFTELGTLGGETARPMDMNDCGQIIGQSDTAGAAWLESLEIRLRLRDPRVVKTWTKVKEVVFKKWYWEGSWGASFLWEKGRMTNIHDLIPSDSGWFLTRVYSINDRGQIVGEGVVEGPNGKLEGKAFLLTPLKEN